MRPVLVFGEILFDQFESGESVLGGAPLNVAWHLHGLGLSPTLLSRLGNDEAGSRARSIMNNFGLQTKAIQHDGQHATGCVKVALDQGTPSFEIVADVAYDYIDYPRDLIEQTDFALLYHGSLALRSDTSYKTLMALRRNTDCEVFVDINLRSPFWEKTLIGSLLSGADWVKLNHEELMIITGNAASVQREALIDSAVRLRRQYDFKALIVTCGEHGAFIVTDQDIIDMPPVKPEKILDTVGAGDGFSAIVIAGILRKQDFRTILDKASKFAARICGIRGAVPDSLTFYDGSK